jgi:hypothetical protein
MQNSPERASPGLGGRAMLDVGQQKAAGCDAHDIHGQSARVKRADQQRQVLLAVRDEPA